MAVDSWTVMDDWTAVCRLSADPQASHPYEFTSPGFTLF